MSGPPADNLRIALISDVHANALAFRAALAEARLRGFDRMVILGDLLTYGCAPLEVLDLAQEAASRDGAVFIKGNHDQLYIDLTRGDHAYYDGLPGWLREAAAWTDQAIQGRDVEGMFAWQNAASMAGVFFAHANPFTYGDWSYLNRPEDLERAARRLHARKHQFGIFGHTHRSKIYSLDRSDNSNTLLPVVLDKPARRFTLNRGNNIFIADVGSVGQPRGDDKTAKFAMLETAKDAIQIDFVRLDYDVAAHCQAVAQSNMSDQTKQKLLGFFTN